MHMLKYTFGDQKNKTKRNAKINSSDKSLLFTQGDLIEPPPAPPTSKCAIIMP